MDRSPTLSVDCLQIPFVARLVRLRLAFRDSDLYAMAIEEAAGVPLVSRTQYQAKHSTTSCFVAQDCLATKSLLLASLRWLHYLACPDNVVREEVAAERGGLEMAGQASQVLVQHQHRA